MPYLDLFFMPMLIELISVKSMKLPILHHVATMWLILIHDCAELKRHYRFMASRMA